MDEIWRRAGHGKHSAVLGQPVGDPPAALALRVVRVSCDVPATTLGPLLEARHKVEQILDSEAPLLDQARGRVVAGLRRHLLGDLSALATDGSLVDAWNRLAHLDERRTVLIFDAIDAADEGTLDLLRQILGRPGWLRVPLLLVYRGTAPTGAAGRLLDALRAAEGADAVRGASVAPEEPRAEGARVAPPFDLASLPPDVLRVLRAGAVVGSGFEAALVAEVLGLDPLFVLEALQRAHDLGLSLDDRGEGRIHLPEPVIEALRASTLPSLAMALHRRFAERLDREPVTTQSDRAAAMAEPLEASIDVARTPSSDATFASPSSSAFAPPPVPVFDPPPVAIEEAAAALDPPSDPIVEASPTPKSEAAASEDASLAEDPRWPLPGLAEALAAGDIRLDPPSAHLPDAVEPEASPIAPVEAAPLEKELFPAPPVVEAHHVVSDVVSDGTDDVTDDGTDDPPPPFVANDSDANVVPIWFKPFGGERRAQRDEVAAPFRAPPMEAPREPRPSPTGAARSRPRPVEARRARAPEVPSPNDAARAASHLAAAGEPEAGAERFFAAARQAAAMGAYPQAAAHDRKALALLDGLLTSPRRRRLRVAILLDLGRLRWHAAGPDASFALRGALEALEAARASLQGDDPPELAAEVAALIAGVCHDLGDLASLQRALDELTTASRRLMNAGDPLGAARLLNDQASVYLRLGDPVQATHLLEESRKVFEDRAAADPVAMVEMAETDHLLSTIPLRVAARPGREADALTMGLDHALAAERVYRKLGAPRELARVWETMGRIELRRGRAPRATERLSSAMQVQESIGDLIGLARSTAGLAEVLSAGGRHRDALTLLADSVSFNLEKGSPYGVAQNRRAFARLVAHAPSDREVAVALAQVDERLRTAESVLGRIALPGERDGR